MTAEVWFRNHRQDIVTLVAEGVDKFVWHRGTAIKRRIDPVAFHRLAMPASLPWRILVVGAQGAIEYDEQSRNQQDAVACYPTWHLGDPIEDLYELAENNVGLDEHALNDPTVEPFFRPRYGQEHRLVIINVPDMHTTLGRRVLHAISDVQALNPHCIVHLFEAGSYRSPLNAGLRSFDFDVGIRARMKEVVLPNGKRVRNLNDFDTHTGWFRLMGMSSAQAKQSHENRVTFGVRSVRWAAENWDNQDNFNTLTGLPTARHRWSAASIKPLIGDKVACDHCSLFDSCKQARDGGVCNLPEAETVNLAKFFKTRDADQIIEGLGAVLQAQAERAEAAIEWERESEKLDPELTKVLKSMAEGGEKLAKLINPALAGPKIALQINQGNGSSAVVAPNMKILMANAVKELEDRGVPRADISPDLVMRFLTAGPAAALAAASDPGTIDAEVVDESESV